MEQAPLHFYVMAPVYNAEPYLDECIQSVLNQTYPHFTFILVDDGSTDRSGAICDEYAAKDTRIRVIHKENRGPLHTRRIAISEAGSDGYGVFVDSDDFLRPHALETIFNKIQTYHCDCVIYGMEDVQDGKVVGQSRILSQDDVIIRDKRELFRAVLLGPDTAFYSLCRKAVRMELLTKDLSVYEPYFHVVMGEDPLQSLEIYEKADSFCFIPDMLYGVHLNPNSIMRGIRYETYRVNYTRYQTEWDFLKRMGVFTSADFYEYRTMQLHCLTGDIVRIAGLNTSRKNRIGLYQKIKETDYWKALSADGPYDKKGLGKMSIIYEVFRKGYYDVLFVLTAVYAKFQ